MNMLCTPPTGTSNIPSEAVVQLAYANPGQQKTTSTHTNEESLVRDLVAIAMQEPPIRTERVLALKKALADGTYKIDPWAIASAMCKVM